MLNHPSNHPSNHLIQSLVKHFPKTFIPDLRIIQSLTSMIKSLACFRARLDHPDLGEKDEKDVQRIYYIDVLNL